MVAAGEALLAPSVTRRLLDRFAATLPGEDHARTLPALESLTDRELEVLRLLARGLSNTELARELFLSEATVKTHVSSVLRKLDLRDRVQAVVLAYEAGLVRPGTRRAETPLLQEEEPPPRPVARRRRVATSARRRPAFAPVPSDAVKRDCRERWT